MLCCQLWPKQLHKFHTLLPKKTPSPVNSSIHKGIEILSWVWAGRHWIPLCLSVRGMYEASNVRTWLVNVYPEAGAPSLQSLSDSLRAWALQPKPTGLAQQQGLEWQLPGAWALWRSSAGGLLWPLSLSGCEPSPGVWGWGRWSPGLTAGSLPFFPQQGGRLSWAEVWNPALIHQGTILSLPQFLSL